MDKILNIVLLVLSPLLIIVILLQNRGSGLGAAFGGGDGNVYRTKRGLEKSLFYATIIISLIFFGVALAFFFIRQ